MLPAMIWLPPNQTTARVVIFIAVIMRGMVKITTFTAFSVLSFRSVLAFELVLLKLFPYKRFYDPDIRQVFLVAMLSASSFFCMAVKRGRQFMML